MVGLPIKSLWKASRGHCETKNQLLEYYNLAFDAKVRGFIAKQRFLSCSVIWKGIMIGRGEIRINRGGRSSRRRTIAINNNPPWSPEDN
jgi:hypothetical protein